MLATLPVSTMGSKMRNNQDELDKICYKILGCFVVGEICWYRFDICNQTNDWQMTQFQGKNMFLQT